MCLFHRPKRKGKPQRAKEPRACTRVKTHSTCQQPLAPPENPSGPSSREPVHHPSRPLALAQPLKPSQQWLETTDCQGKALKSIDNSLQKADTQSRPRTAQPPIHLKALAAVTASPDSGPVCFPGPDTPQGRWICNMYGPKMCGFYLHGGASE